MIRQRHILALLLIFWAAVIFTLWACTDAYIFASCGSAECIKESL